MNTILYSVVGILLLIGISFLTSYLGESKKEKASKQLADFRKKLALNNDWLLHNSDKIVPTVFRRPIQNRKLNIFTPSGDQTTL